MKECLDLEVTVYLLSVAKSQDQLQFLKQVWAALGDWRGCFKATLSQTNVPHRWLLRFWSSDCELTKRDVKDKLATTCKRSIPADDVNTNDWSEAENSICLKRAKPQPPIVAFDFDRSLVELRKRDDGRLDVFTRKAKALVACTLTIERITAGHAPLDADFIRAERHRASSSQFSRKATRRRDGK